MNLSELSTDYVNRYAAYQEEAAHLQRRIQQRHDQIARLESKRARLERPSWIDIIVEGIAKELINLFPGRYFKLLGPHGLAATTSIHFYKNGGEDITSCLSITFRPGNLNQGELGRVDYSKNTGYFAAGSLGELNGMNYPEIPLPPNTEIAALAQFVT